MNETQLDGKSADIVSQNIEQLKQLFPEVFTENKIDFERLQEVLGEYVEDKEERYRFEWHGKSQALRLSQTPSMGTLRPCKEESKDWDTTQNLYIEGDNLEVLKLLQKSYYNKVKMIYIDPPYNTGKDFVYKDNFRDGIQNYLEVTGQTEGGVSVTTNKDSSGRYHTDWLNMMYPRLRLARNLLTDDGVIFISIDDNEIDNLLKMCNEIFSEENHLGTFIIKSTPNARDYGHIAKMHEFVVFYSKNQSFTKTNLLVDENKSFKYEDKISKYNIHPLYNSNVAFTDKNRPNLYYPFYVNSEIGDDGFYEISLDRKEGFVEIYPPKSVKDQVQFVWRWGKEKSKENLNMNIVGHKVGDEFRIVQKMRNSEKLIRSIIDDKGVTSRRGTAEVEDVFGRKIFSFPKPLELLSQFLKIGTDPDSIILDFFSGSATTAHSIFNLNATENGKRKFILVQLPEKLDNKSEAYQNGYFNLCEIGKERIRRAGNKIKIELIEKHKKQTNTQMSMLGEKNQEKIINPSNLDFGFKVFKLDSSNLKKWNPEFDNLENNLLDMVENFVDDRTEEDVLYEIMLKYGLDLTYPVESEEVNGKTVYNIGYGMLFVCMSKEIDMGVAEYIINKRDDLIEKSEENEGRRKSVTVVFLDNGFKTDDMKTNVKLKLEQAGFDKIVSV